MAPAEHANVIAIDPGYDRVGIAIFSKDKLEHSECFSPVSKNFTERLLETKKRIEELTTKFSPHACALETLFFSKNTKTALKVAEASYRKRARSCALRVFTSRSKNRSYRAWEC